MHRHDSPEHHENSEHHENPLLPVVLRLLRAQPAGISEYELLKCIEADGEHFGQPAADAQLALFRKHFLIMNALYRLQDVLWREEHMRLVVSPLRIVLETADAGAARGGDIAPHSLAACDDTALRAYYLDWQQFVATDSAAVAELLAGFWRRYVAHDGRAEALATLQLDTDADADAIKRQYRRLAAATHPDRGGDAAQFLAVRTAYETLRLSLR